MSSTIEKIDKFHKTRKGLLTFGLIELLVAYMALSMAIDQGSFLYYGIFILLVIGSLNNLVRAGLNRPMNNGKKRRSK
jgi:hypothetical protein